LSYHRLNIPFVLAVSLAVLVVLLLTGREAKKSKAAPKKDALRAALLGSASPNQELQKFNLTGFDEKGKRFWNLEGQNAQIDPTQTVFLEQNVTLRLRDDTIIKTDKVEWSQGRALLKTDARVYVTHQSADIRGLGAVGRPNEGFIQLNRHIEMDMENGARITCSGPMKIFYNENKAIFYRNVRVRDARGILTARRMDVFFDGENKKISRIEALGNVVIERGTDTTHSRRAIYTPSNGAIRLEGNPEITLHKGSSRLLDGAVRN